MMPCEQLTDSRCQLRKYLEDTRIWSILPVRRRKLDHLPRPKSRGRNQNRGDGARGRDENTDYHTSIHVSAHPPGTRFSVRERVSFRAAADNGGPDGLVVVTVERVDVGKDEFLPS
jgi:hypothetical protein